MIRAMMMTHPIVVIKNCVLLKMIALDVNTATQRMTVIKKNTTPFVVCPFANCPNPGQIKEANAASPDERFAPAGVIISAMDISFMRCSNECCLFAISRTTCAYFFSVFTHPLFVSRILL